ncbi:MAG: AMP-binding protein [Ruminococcus sp.]|nr:AMP-binding protein [Ruminococcus sp.]
MSQKYELEYFGQLADYAAEKYADSSGFICANGQTVSYRQFREDVRAAAERFSDERGRHIVLIGGNSYRYITLFFAVICSGNIVVPINKDAGSAELDVIVSDCKPSAAIITDGGEAAGERLREVCPDLKIAELSAEDAGAASAEKWYFAPEGRETCCIIYTSGSSGTPKGVMLSQQSMIYNAISFSRALSLTGRTLLCLPLHHMFAWATCVLSPIFLGSELVINSDPVMLTRDMQTYSPKMTCAVPAIPESYYRQLLFMINRSEKLKKLYEEGTLDGRPVEERRAAFADVIKILGGDLEVIVCGGAPLDREILLFFEKIGIEIIFGYGMTELSPVISANRIGNKKLGSVGLPIDCNEVMIASPDSEGGGEICVRGVNLMNGYYGRPEETEAAFQNGYLRTGDKGRIDSDGFIFITGRIKNIIIRSSGENISPEELETAISVIPEVTEVLVVEENGLIAAKVYSAERSGDIEAGVLAGIEKLNASLPAFKRIDKTDFMEKPFEKTSTNKIKRK